MRPRSTLAVLRNVNRGLAVAEGKVFMTTLNAHVPRSTPRTERRSGIAVRRRAAGESATVAPLVVKDMVIVGSSGGESGSRPPDAFKLETGERVWRCYMVPKPGEPGS